MNQKNNEKECCVTDVRDTLKRFVRLAQMFERDQIKIFNFTSTQCYTLLELRKSNGLTMQDLSEKMNLSTSTMTRIVDKLVEGKYIKRTRHDSDRRVVVVSLTEKGVESSQVLNDSLNQYYERTIANLPDGRIEEVFNSAELLLRAFEKANPKCC